MKDYFVNAIIKMQNYYLDQIQNNEVASSLTISEHEMMHKAALEGMQFEATRDHTAVYIENIFKIIEQWGRAAEWITLLEDSVQLNYSQPVHLINVRNNLGRLYYLRRNFDDALSWHHQALSLAHTYSPLHVAISKRHICHCYINLKEIDMAEKYALEALHFFQEGHYDPQQEAIIYNALGLIYINRQAYALAQEKLEKAANLWQKAKNPTQLAKTYINLGVAAFNQNLLDMALDCYQKATHILNDLSHSIDWLRAMNNMSNIYYEKKDFERSEAILHQTLVKSNTIEGVFHIKGSLNHNMGNTLLALKRLGEAEIYLKNGLRCWQQANDEFEAGYTTGVLGELYEKRQMTEASIAANETAIAYLTKFKSEPRADQLIKTYTEAINRMKHAR